MLFWFFFKRISKKEGPSNYSHVEKASHIARQVILERRNCALVTGLALILSLSLSRAKKCFHMGRKATAVTSGRQVT